MNQRLVSIKGFTFVELLITIAIVGILAAIAIPSYTEYLKRSRFSELVNAAQPFKKAVDICYQSTGTLANCSSGQNGVPQNMTNNSSSLAAFIFTLPNGLIFVFPNNRDGFNLIGDFYTMTPSVNNGTLSWTYGGPGARYI